jgi:DNA-binding MarR family transcriptional regulator
MDGPEALSSLDRLVLKAIPKARKIEDLAKVANVPPSILGRTVAKLQLEGYIAGNGSLTQKGRDAIEDQS